MKVLSDNLGIQNDNLLDQIKLIAKGNIRLAIMAGMCAINGEFGSIRNAFDIFNDYYADIIDKFDRNEILVATIIAFFDPDFDAFRNIHIMPTHASWSGSEVPIIEQYIAFLIKFRENLKGIQFIEHRAYISEEIQDLQKRKEEVLLREFLEER